jgi:hypothetical protein
MEVNTMNTELKKMAPLWEHPAVKLLGGIVLVAGALVVGLFMLLFCLAIGFHIAGAILAATHIPVWLAVILGFGIGFGIFAKVLDSF